MRDARDGRDSWDVREERGGRNRRFDSWGSTFRQPRTSDLEPQSVVRPTLLTWPVLFQRLRGVYFPV